jgi:hypothetical protein
LDGLVVKVLGLDVVGVFTSSFDDGCCVDEAIGPDDFGVVVGCDIELLGILVTSGTSVKVGVLFGIWLGDSIC